MIMKTYIWIGNLFLMAVAETEHEAKELIIKEVEEREGYISDAMLIDLKMKPIVKDGKCAHYAWF
jgi:uncharacterized protein (DUF1697 family)